MKAAARFPVCWVTRAGRGRVEKRKQIEPVILRQPAGLKRTVESEGGLVDVGESEAVLC